MECPLGAEAEAVIKNIRNLRTGFDSLEVEADFEAVKIKISPGTLAALFWEMNDEQQARFLAEVARLTDQCENPGAIMQHDLISFAVDKLEDESMIAKTRHMLDQWNDRGLER